MLEGVERLVNLVGDNTFNLSGADEARLAEAVRDGDVETLSRTDGQFAVAARNGITVRLARTLGTPLRYFVAKRMHGPFLIVSDRIDAIYDYCCERGIGWQFNPAYTRMVPANYLVEIDQVGCPDPNPRYTRFFNPEIGGGTEDAGAFGEAYMAKLYEEIRRWIAALPEGGTVGVCFSGGIDSSSVLLLAVKAVRELGRPLSTVRAFTLDLGEGKDCGQALEIVKAFGLEEIWEPVRPASASLDPMESIEIIEDYHPLDVECASAVIRLLEEVRRQHPKIRFLLDGDGGDENLKSYPLEASDLTLQSVLKNPLLYHEGWGVDAIKHSLTYSGGFSRACVRGYAPASRFGFEIFSPYIQRSVIREALRAPFDKMVNGSIEKLYELKGEAVKLGLKKFAGLDMPVFPKRRFQDGVGGASDKEWRRSKTWCKLAFDGLWRDRIKKAWDETMERVSGNDVSEAAREI